MISMSRKELHEWIDDLYDDYSFKNINPEIDLKDEWHSHRNCHKFSLAEMLQRDQRKVSIMEIIGSLKYLLDNDSESDYLSPHRYIDDLEHQVYMVRKFFEHEE